MRGAIESREESGFPSKEACIMGGVNRIFFIDEEGGFLRSAMATAIVHFHGGSGDSRTAGDWVVFFLRYLDQ